MRIVGVLSTFGCRLLVAVGARTPLTFAWSLGCGDDERYRGGHPISHTASTSLTAVSYPVREILLAGACKWHRELSDFRPVLTGRAPVRIAHPCRGSEGGRSVSSALTLQPTSIWARA